MNDRQTQHLATEIEGVADAITAASITAAATSMVLATIEIGGENAPTPERIVSAVSAAVAIHKGAAEYVETTRRRP